MNILREATSREENKKNYFSSRINAEGKDLEELLWEEKQHKI